MASRRSGFDEAAVWFFLPHALSIAVDAFEVQARALGGLLGVDYGSDRMRRLRGQVDWAGETFDLEVRVETFRGGTAIRATATGEIVAASELLETLQAWIEEHTGTVRYDESERAAGHVPPRLLVVCREGSVDVAGRITDRLRTYFGRSAVSDHCVSGGDASVVRTRLIDELSTIAAMLVVIGPTWLTGDEPGERRPLDREDDVVRIALDTALRTSVAVVPVLVDDAPVPPAAELPESLRSFAERQATRVRADPDFHTDADRLIRRLTADLTTEAIGP